MTLKDLTRDLEATTWAVDTCVTNKKEIDDNRSIEDFIWASFFLNFD
jgi:hypothetical protein